MSVGKPLVDADQEVDGPRARIVRRVPSSVARAAGVRVGRCSECGTALRGVWTCTEQLAPHHVEILRKLRRQRPRRLKRLQLVRQRRIVGERKPLGRRLEEEVERIVDRHLRHEIHLDLELLGLLREDEPREVVRLRILLPIDEMFAGRRSSANS